jgi:oligopeptide transport system ATP-binding protein
MCNDIAVMYGGKVVEYGTADEIFYEPHHEYTKGLLRSVPKLTDDTAKRLFPIKGSPIDMIDPPKGCPFAPRCDSCMKICMEQMPPYTVFSENHAAACWQSVKIQDAVKQTG